MSQSATRINKRQSITIKEVAERAGVSLMTVSRVLNKQSVVREETRKRVEEAMRDLNYRPNILARGLAGGNALFIGLIHANPSHGYLSEMLVGALNACRQAGHHLVLEDLSADTEQATEAEVENRLRNIGLNGIIVTPPLSESPQAIKALQALNIPFVLVGSGLQPKGEMTVGIDDRAAAQAMTNHLIEQGHRRIGFVIGAKDQTSSQRRYDGFAAAMESHGLALREGDVVQGDFTYRSGMQAGEKLLDQNNPPTAIFASNDDMAAGVMATAHKRGLKIPQDLSVAGFDDTPMATAIWPQLTTIRQPIADIASNAIDMLSDTVSGEADKSMEKNKLLDIAVIERESVGPPKKS